VGRLVRSVRDADGRIGPDIRTSQKGVRRRGSTIDQIELGVDNSTIVARYGPVRGLAGGGGLVRAIGYADRRVWPYIRTGEEHIGGRDRTSHEVILVFDRRARIIRDGRVGRFTCWSFVWAIRDADGGLWPYICTSEEGIGGLDCTGDEVILVFDRRAGIIRDGRVGQFACWSFVWVILDADGGI
jgi:hypothetical protein